MTNIHVLFQPRVNGKLSLSLHGVRRIHQEIGEDLLELAHVAHEVGHLFLHVCGHFNVLELGFVDQEIQALGQEVFQAERGSLARRFPAELEEVADNFLAPQSLIDNFLKS
jgi:hypothetical protein